MTPTFLEASLAAASLLMLCALWWRRWQTRWLRKLRLSGARGTVYVMQDREQPHLLKVGFTTRPSRERQAEIVRTMAAGAPLRQLGRLLAEVELAARDVKRLARRHHAWSRDDEEHAYRWALTRTGPIRERLFQPGAIH